MQVRLCKGCLYKPEDLGEHYNPNAEQPCCANCIEDIRTLPQAPKYKRERRRWGYAGKEAHDAVHLGV